MDFRQKPLAIPNGLDELEGDLQRSVIFDRPKGMWVLEHPMIKVSLCGPSETPTPALINCINRIYHNRRTKSYHAAHYNNWWEFLLNFDESSRLYKLIEIKDEIESSTQYWQLVKWLWCTSFIKHEDMEGFITLFTDPRPYSEAMMDGHGIFFLDQAPDKLTIWRGSGGLDLGWSWSISKDLATCHAHLGPGHPFLFEGICFKTDVLACFNSGHEDEILIPPEKVHILKVHDVTQNILVN